MIDSMGMAVDKLRKCCIFRWPVPAAEGVATVEYLARAPKSLSPVKVHKFSLTLNAETATGDHVDGGAASVDDALMKNDGDDLDAIEDAFAAVWHCLR